MPTCSAHGAGRVARGRVTSFAYPFGKFACAAIRAVAKAPARSRSPDPAWQRPAVDPIHRSPRGRQPSHLPAQALAQGAWERRETGYPGFPIARIPLRSA